MPSPKPFLKQLEIKEYTGSPLALNPIKRQAKSNESGAGFPMVKLTMPASAPAGVYYSDGKAVAVSTPDRTLYAPASPPFEDGRAARTRGFVVCKHHNLPKYTRLLLARESATTALAVAAVTPFSGVTLTYSAASPEGFVNAARADIHKPFYLFEDSAAETIHGIHLQLTRSATASVYDPLLDQGNTGRAVLDFYVPIQEGLLSGRASEYAEETAGDGPAFIWIRPRFDKSAAPEQPYLDNVTPTQTFPDGVDDLITEPWRQIGCLASLKELNILIEYAETMKNYSNDVINRTKSQDRAEVNCTMTGKNIYGLAIMNGGVINDLNGAFKQVIPTAFLDKFECLIVSSNSNGYVRCYYMEDVNITRNGAEQFGARGESVIPFQIKGNLAGRDFLSNSLYQTTTLIVECALT